MSGQANKSHNYPTHRKSYSSGRKGIGGRKKKNVTATTNKMKTYFEKQLEQQRKAVDGKE